MPEEVQTTPVEGAADPSPAPFEIPKAGTEAYHKWRMSSGNIPDDASKAEDTGEPKPEASASSTSESPASEAGPKSQEQHKPPQRKGADDRINEFLSDIKSLGLKPNDLKLSRDELFKRLSPPSAPPQPQAVPEKTEQPAAAPAKREPPKEPEFKGDWELFEKENRQYVKDLVAYESDTRVEAAIAKEREAQQQMMRQAVFREKLDAAKQRYGAEADSKIVRTAQQISRDQKIHPAVKELLGESDILADVLYAMSGDPDELETFLAEARDQPGKAIRRAVILENFVRDELEGKAAAPAREQQPRGDNGQFVAATPQPARKTTSAPAPPTEVSGRGSPPGDEQERASRNGDFRSFRQIDNQRALARLRGS